MPAYTVRVLGVIGFLEGPQLLTFQMKAPNYGEAVIAVGIYLETEQIPYRCFAGSRDLGH